MFQGSNQNIEWVMDHKQVVNDFGVLSKRSADKI